MVRSRSWLGVLVAGLSFGVGGASGCRRNEPAGGASDAGGDGALVVAVAASASATASATPTAPTPKEVRPSLVVRAAPKGAARAHLVVEGLDIDEDLAPIAAPNACSGHMHEGAWRVTCTPELRKVLVTLRMTPEGLAIERAPRPPRVVRTPSGVVLAADAQVVGERDLRPCTEDAGIRPFPITLGAHENVLKHVVSLQLTAGRTSVILANAPPKCDLKTDGDQADLTCKDKPTCSVTVHGAVVDIACDEPEVAHGALVAPCGTTPKLPSILERTIAHYGVMEPPF